MEFNGYALLGSFIPAEHFVILELEKRTMGKNRSMSMKFVAAISGLLGMLFEIEQSL